MTLTTLRQINPTAHGFHELQCSLCLEVPGQQDPVAFYGCQPSGSTFAGHHYCYPCLDKAVHTHGLIFCSTCNGLFQEVVTTDGHPFPLITNANQAQVDRNIDNRLRRDNNPLFAAELVGSASPDQARRIRRIFCDIQAEQGNIEALEDFEKRRGKLPPETLGHLLISAAARGHNSFVEQLSEREDVRSEAKGVALIAASQRGHHRVIPPLLLDGNIPEEFKDTAKREAQQAGHVLCQAEFSSFFDRMALQTQVLFFDLGQLFKTFI